VHVHVPSFVCVAARPSFLRILYIGVLWALRDVLRVLQGDAVAGADLAAALLQKEYELALTTPACPGVHKMRLEWLIPLLTQGISNA
jgi:hypothetical protein